MANWSPLRDALAAVDDRMTFAWTDLDELVGGLPPVGLRARGLLEGRQIRVARIYHGRRGRRPLVTFVRRSADRGAARRRETKNAPASVPAEAGRVDVVLVGCVKRKLDRPAPAQGIYTSSLFRKERSYAEANGTPWFVLSAEHGPVTPANGSSCGASRESES